MAHAYTPGLKVTEGAILRRRRVLPIAGEVLVEAGARVGARDVVAETFMPGDVTPVNLANLLALPPADVPACMLKQEGDWVEAGEILAQTKGFWGFFKSEATAKVSGRLEAVSSVTGQVMLRGNPLPVRVLAFIPGNIIEVIPGEGCVVETEAVFVQGIFGIGGEAFGPICMACSSPDQTLEAEAITPEMRGAVVVGGGRMTLAAIRAAKEVGVSALISGGIDDLDLQGFLGYDLGVAITGSERMGLTLVITEGFGDIAMAKRTFALLGKYAGREASVTGATQIRAGVMRPEIVIAMDPDVERSVPETARQDGLLEIDTTVRMIRDPYFGQIGKVHALPAEPMVLASGSKARVVEVVLETGETVTVPRANIELIEE